MYTEQCVLRVSGVGEVKLREKELEKKSSVAQGWGSGYRRVLETLKPGRDKDGDGGFVRLGQVVLGKRRLRETTGRREKRE